MACIECPPPRWRYAGRAMSLLVCLCFDVHSRQCPSMVPCAVLEQVLEEDFRRLIDLHDHPPYVADLPLSQVLRCNLENGVKTVLLDQQPLLGGKREGATQ